MKKILVLLFGSLIFFLIFPLVTLATIDAQLPEKDTIILLNYIQAELPDQAIRRFDPGSQEWAAIMLVQNYSKTSVFSYWMGYVSKKLIITSAKMFLKASSPLISSGAITVIWAIERANDINDAKNIFEDWLTKNKIRINVQLLDGKNGLWYVLAYIPLKDENYGEVLAVFYSPKILNIPSGYYYSGNKVYSDGGFLNPFKLEISGNVKRENFPRKYFWEKITEGPKVSFSENILEFPITKSEQEQLTREEIPELVNPNYTLSIGNIKNNKLLEPGCGCSFSIVNDPAHFIFLSNLGYEGNSGKAALMNIDGQDTKLQFVSSTERIGQGWKKGDRFIEKYIARGIEVQIEYIATGPINAGGESEVTEFDAIITVNKAGGTQMVKARGGCGC